MFREGKLNRLPPPYHHLILYTRVGTMCLSQEIVIPFRNSRMLLMSPFSREWYTLPRRLGEVEENDDDPAVL